MGQDDPNQLPRCDNSTHCFLASPDRKASERPAVGPGCFSMKGLGGSGVLTLAQPLLLHCEKCQDLQGRLLGSINCQPQAAGHHLLPQGEHRGFWEKCPARAAGLLWRREREAPGSTAKDKLSV